jgi:alpha-L-fucosidase 2
MKSKIILIAGLFLLAQGALAQEKPASERSGRIDAKWVDRATFSGESKKPEGRNILWYKQSAKVWEEALPLGNGHLGAMVFGGVSDERLQLNDNTLWDGYPMDANNPRALEALPEVQRLLFEDKNEEAVKLASETMLGTPKHVKPYQSLGELWLDTPHENAQNYVRSLDLSTAIATTKYTNDGVEYTREYFASGADGVIIVRFTADKKNKINLTLTLRRAKDAVCTGIVNDPNSLLLSGTIDTKDKEGNPRGLSFAAQVKAVTDKGKVTVSDSILSVKDANVLTLYIAGSTNYPGLKNIAQGNFTFSADPVQTCATMIQKVLNKSYNGMKAAHIVDHQNYYNRFDLKLADVSKEIDALPTNKRLDLARETGTPDLGLVETYFQFGRYLLISSSRPGSMPTNLQGLWAWQMNPPWNADYHTNINFQMNYWPADITNLSDCHVPMFDLMDILVKPGSKTARVMYDARGWVVHHLTDAWGFTVPADGVQGIWPMGSAWLAQHPWDHYTYTGDKEFLRTRAYPLMKGAAEFIFDFLVEAPASSAYAGMLVTNPSHSPENAFFLPDGTTSEFTYGATMDLQLIRDLLTNCIQATEILNVDANFRAECEKVLARVPETRISPATGRIMEWVEDYKEVDPHHRHTSHLFGLHPSNQITVVGTPELAAAARKTLDMRGDAGTGWGLAWKINMWNRLHDGDRAFKLLAVLLATKTLPNLFDDHPPFQIDGNFGATAAIAEMLVQSHLQTANGNYEAHLIPSLPAIMSSKGSAKGIRARGGFIIDLSWENGALKEAEIKSTLGGKLALRTGEYNTIYDTQKGEMIKIKGNLQKN